MKCDKLILAHRGALGDFLTAWPAMLALARLENWVEVHCFGRGIHLPWSRSLETTPLPPTLSREVERLTWSATWPQPLKKYHVAWFSLSGAPLAVSDKRLFVLRGLDPAEGLPPRVAYARSLARLGVAADPEPASWLPEWRRSAGCWDGPAGKDTLLLFPGAGHPRKAWPMERFTALAERAGELGLRPCFVLGPVELERGFDSGTWPNEAPADGEALSRILRTARAVVSNDSGPMHLAGMFGVPGVALFGPTPARVWGPLGLTVLRGRCPRRPCTLTTADLDCREAVCMESIEVGEVLEALQGQLRASEVGSPEP